MQMKGISYKQLSLIKACLHRLFFVKFFDGILTRASWVASSNRVCKLAAISVRFGRDLLRDVAEVLNISKPDTTWQRFLENRSNSQQISHSNRTEIAANLHL